MSKRTKSTRSRNTQGTSCILQRPKGTPIMDAFLGLTFVVGPVFALTNPPLVAKTAKKCVIKTPQRHTRKAKRQTFVNCFGHGAQVCRRRNWAERSETSENLPNTGIFFFWTHGNAARIIHVSRMS